MTNRKYFRKILYLYTVLTLVYTLMFTGLFYYKSSEVFNVHVDANYRSYIRQTGEMIDSNFILSKSQLNLVLTNDYVVDLVEGVEDKGIPYLKVHELLSRVDSTLPDSNHRITLIFDDGNTVISSEGVYSADYLYDECGFDRDTRILINEVTKGEKDIPEKYLFFRSRANDDDTLISVLSREYAGYGKYLFSLITFYENDLLPQFIPDKQRGFVIVSDGNILGKSTVLEDEIFNEYFLKQIGNLHSIQGARIKIHDVDYNIFSTVSKLLDWRYYLVIRNSVTQIRGNLLLDALLLYVLLGLVGTAVSLFVTRKLYRPVWNILDVFKGLNPNRMEDDEHDEFSFIRKAAADMKDSNESLKKIVSENRTSLKNKYLTDLLYGIIPREKIHEGIQSYNLMWLDDSTVVTIIEYMNYDFLEESFSSQDIADIMLHVWNVLKEYLGDELHYTLVEIDRKRYAVIMLLNEVGRLKGVLSRAFSYIEMNFDISLTAAIGPVCDDIHEIDKSFFRALSMLEHRFVMGKVNIITYDEYSNRKRSSCYYPLEMERKIINSVLSGSATEVNTMLSRVFDENLNIGTIDTEIVSQIIFAVNSTVKRILYQLNKSAVEVFGDDRDLFQFFSESRNAEELKDRVLKAFNTILDYVHNESTHMDDSLVVKITEYIHEHYHLDLSLTDIAENFNLSMGYVSGLFNEKTGKSFRKFLNEIRIQKAKDIFQYDPEKKIKEVGEEVGFMSLNTFIRIFKKHEGITPGMFIKNISQVRLQ